MQAVEISVIISFYNKLRELDLVLASCKKQQFTNFEVIIADDGSGKEVTEKIKYQIQGKYSFPISHIWQEDNGWQKNKILNKAIMHSRADYIVFIDGDCILHPAFLLEHYKNREDRILLAGRRVYMPEYISLKLTPDFISKRNFHRVLFFYSLWYKIVYKQGKHIENGIYLKNTFLRKLLNKNKKRKILGSNFSINKYDILRLNGFDERYNGPGIGEDTDIYHRFTHDGGKIKMMKFIAVQYHIHHNRRKQNPSNRQILESVIKNRTIRTGFGIEKMNP